MNEASGDERTPLSASTESLKSPRPVSPVAMEITGKPMETARGRNEHVKRKHKPEDKHSNISSVAKNVTSRLYQPPEPKFKYVAKSKQKEIKTASGRPRNPKERDLDAIGRGSPPRILRNQNTRHSPSPQRDLSRSGSNSPSRFVRNSDKRQSPSPLRQSPSPLRQSPSPLRQSPSRLRDTGRKSSPSPAKGKGKVIDSSAGDKEGKPPLKKADPKYVTNKEAKHDGHDAPRTDKKESLIMAVRNKAPVDNTAALIDLKMRRSPDRLGVVPNRHVVTSPMRQMASTSSLASVPESLHEEDGGPLGSSTSSQQLIKKRNKRGRALLDEDEFRRHSAPDYDKLENEFNAYSKEMMGFNPSEKENVSVSPTYRTSVSVDESELLNSQLPEESDTAFSEAAAKSATSETQTNHDQIEKEQRSKFYVSSSDEMTSEETENMKEPTECSISEIVLETISDQSENNVNEMLREDGIGDVKATADTKNDIEPEAILIGMKRDHIDGPNNETLSIPPVKKSKSHEHDYTQLSAEAALKKEHDESFSNDSLDEEENSDSIQKNKDAIHTDRLTQSLPDNLLLLKENREKSVSDDSLEVTEDDTKDNLDSMDLDAGTKISELGGNAEMDLDIVINQNGDMLKVEVVDNSPQPEIEDSQVDISDSRETDFQYEDPETFIVTLDIKTDESVSVQSLEDTNNSGTSVKDNVCNVDKVDSENQISNNEEHLEKLKNVNVVSSNLAKDMVDELVHEELEVHLALEGETMLTHEEIEVELKLEVESCVLGSEGRHEPSSENNDKLESEHKALSIKTESFKNIDDETNDVIMNYGTIESNTDDNERVEEIMEISEADKLESSANKLDSTVLIGNSENDGISATEIFDKCRTIAVWTSQEFIADMDTGLKGAGGLGSDDSLLDPSKELKVLQEALEQLPAK